MDCQRGRLLQESESAGVRPAEAEAVPSEQRLLHHFYRPVVESTVLFSQVCWYNTAKKSDSDRLSHTAATASITIGQQVRSQESVYHESCRSSARSQPTLSPAGQEPGVRLLRVLRLGTRSPSTESLEVRSPESASHESCRSGARGPPHMSPAGQEPEVRLP